MTGKQGKAGPTVPSSKDGPTREARQKASIVLEVLSGERTVGEAAKTLAMSTTGYYLLEQRALDALVGACEPKSPGRVATGEPTIVAMRKRCAQLERECGRWQALARVGQRSLGVAPVKKEGRKAKRRPMRRALAAAKRLRRAAEAMPPTPETSPPLEGEMTCPQDDR